MVNKVILVGSLGLDPEVRYTPSGSAVSNVRLATNTHWRDKRSGEMQQRTEWHQLVFFNRLAELAGEYLKKGSKIYVEGHLQTRKWQDKNGQDRYTTEIVVQEMEMLMGTKPARAHRQLSRADQVPESPASEPEPDSQPAPAPASDIDDDIPFMRLHSLMGG